MQYPVKALLLEQLYCGPSFRELSGGNWMISGDPVVALALGT